ncbi:FliG C-terminal domain-containing protein [Spirochaetia bacterium 38H-sp]|uniref:Flagellar motor switch protein FliG n=1 Tax=Rarispira pelagica TaxID=3141764 RepID=A0ABU9UB87_9SPIR
MDINKKRASAYSRIKKVGEEKLPPHLEAAYRKSDLLRDKSSSASDGQSSRNIRKDNSPLDNKMMQQTGGTYDSAAVRDAFAKLVADKDGALSGASREKKLALIARFLILVGEERAAEILSYLDEPLVEAIAREIAKTPVIKPEEAREVLASFNLAAREAAGPRGGADVAFKILEEAFGPEKARDMSTKLFEAGLYKPFSFLANIPASQIALLLKKESPAVISAILPFLPPAKASEVLVKLDNDVRIKAIKYMAQKRKLDADILERIELALRDRLHNMGDVSEQEINGMDILTEILKNTPIEKEEELLARLREQSPELAERLEERLLTLDLIMQIPDRELADLLREFDNDEIALFLKGKPEEYKSRILKNLSERRRNMVSDEYMRLGGVKRSKVDKITREFLGLLRQRVRDGKIILESDEYVE